MNLKGKIVLLRAIEEKDQELLRGMINDPEIEKMVGGYSFPVSKFEQNEWFKSNINDRNNIRLIIETEEDGVVGFTNIVNIDWKNRTAFHGIKICNKRFETKGIGTDTVMTVMKYVFEELNLERLETTILDYNKASQRLYFDKCGWKKEGERRNSVFKSNKYHNELFVGILKEEYKNLIRLNNYWKSQNV